MKREIVESYPAYDVVKLVDDQTDIIFLRENDELIQAGTGTKHKIGSVAGYAMEYNDCPLEAVERAKQNGHELYYIFGLGTSLTAHKQAKKEYILVAVGDQVYFSGRLFEVTKQNNNNLGLKDLGAFNWLGREFKKEVA